jgi:proteasome accessory factor C
MRANTKEQATRAAGRVRHRAASTAAARLRRLLVVVPYVVRHPGTAVADLARLFGVEEGELVQDLNMLFLSGLPPYGPGDLIDVEVDEGRVWIGMADYFSRPVRLTHQEALSLYLRGKSLLGAPGLEEAPALASALAKIEERLGKEALGALAGRVEVGAGGQAAQALATLRRAVEEQRTVRIEYYGASRDEMTTRDVDPEQLFSAIGNWYVVAWDHRSDDERMFRVDRIRSAELADGTFEPRGLAGAGRPLYTRSERDVPVRLLLGSGARWVAEYYVTESPAERDGGAIEVTLPTRDLAWLVKLVLRLGGEATVLFPPELAARVRDAAAETLRAYRYRTRSPA